MEESEECTVGVLGVVGVVGVPEMERRGTVGEQVLGVMAFRTKEEWKILGRWWPGWTEEGTKVGVKPGHCSGRRVCTDTARGEGPGGCWPDQSGSQVSVRQ